MRERMLSRAFLASLLAAAAGWESGKTCTTDDVRTLAKKDAKLSGTALAECVILDLRGETIAPEMLPRQVVVRTGHGIEDKEDTMIEPTTRMPLLTPAQLGELLGANSTISRVQLGWNFGMKEEGAETVARAIQLNGDTKLRHLEYHLNEMGDRGGVAFGQGTSAAGGGGGGWTDGAPTARRIWVSASLASSVRARAWSSSGADACVPFSNPVFALKSEAPESYEA